MQQASTIDLGSLREQLRLLGHSLPDGQILDILKDMNIDVSDSSADATRALGVAGCIDTRNRNVK
jgi:hypothetical protein